MVGHGRSGSRRPTKRRLAVGRVRPQLPRHSATAHRPLPPRSARAHVRGYARPQTAAAEDQARPTAEPEKRAARDAARRCPDRRSPRPELVSYAHPGDRPSPPRTSRSGTTTCAWGRVPAASLLRSDSAYSICGLGSSRRLPAPARRASGAAVGRAFCPNRSPRMSRCPTWSCACRRDERRPRSPGRRPRPPSRLS
jgi:hypothetical protein